MEVGDAGEVYLTLTHGKEISVFTCNPGDAGWGPKCSHLVAKHT